MRLTDLDHQARLTDHVADGGVCGVIAVCVLTVSILAEMTALIVHAAALELTEQIEEAVFIGGVATQLLHVKHTAKRNQINQMNVPGKVTGVTGC